MSWVKIACWQCKGAVIPDQDYLARDIPLTPRRNILESFKTRLRRIMSKSKVKTNKVSGTNYRHDAQRIHSFVKFIRFMMGFRNKCFQIFCLFEDFKLNFLQLDLWQSLFQCTGKQTKHITSSFLFKSYSHDAARSDSFPSGLIVTKITCMDRSHNAEVTSFRKHAFKKQKTKQRAVDVFLSAPPAKCVEAKNKNRPKQWDVTVDMQSQKLKGINGGAFKLSSVTLR